MRIAVAHKSVRVTGDQHTGWEPAPGESGDVADGREVAFRIEIQFNGAGYLLCASSLDGALYGDTWHASCADAELAAVESFGIRPGDWQRPMVD